MQNAAYIRQFYKAWKDAKMKSMQNAAYIRQFHASPKPDTSPLKPKIDKMLRTFMNFVKKINSQIVHIYDLGQKSERNRKDIRKTDFKS